MRSNHDLSAAGADLLRFIRDERQCLCAVRDQLRDVNIQIFRAHTRQVLTQHSALHRFTLEQATTYGDDWWYFYGPTLVLNDSVQVYARRIPSGTDDSSILDIGLDPIDKVDLPATPKESGKNWKTRQEAITAHFGALLPAASDIVRTIGSESADWSERAYVDTFGYHAQVEVDRDVFRIRRSFKPEDAGWVTHEYDYLDLLPFEIQAATGTYADAPERAHLVSQLQESDARVAERMLDAIAPSVEAWRDQHPEASHHSVGWVQTQIGVRRRFVGAEWNPFRSAYGIPGVNTDALGTWSDVIGDLFADLPSAGVRALCGQRGDLSLVTWHADGSRDVSAFQYIADMPYWAAVPPLAGHHIRRVLELAPVVLQATASHMPHVDGANGPRPVKDVLKSVLIQDGWNDHRHPRDGHVRLLLARPERVADANLSDCIGILDYLHLPMHRDSVWLRAVRRGVFANVFARLSELDTG